MVREWRATNEIPRFRGGFGSNHCVSAEKRPLRATNRGKTSFARHDGGNLVCCAPFGVGNPEDVCGNAYQGRPLLAGDDE